MRILVKKSLVDFLFASIIYTRKCVFSLSAQKKILKISTRDLNINVECKETGYQGLAAILFVGRLGHSYDSIWVPPAIVSGCGCDLSKFGTFCCSYLMINYLWLRLKNRRLLLFSNRYTGFLKYLILIQ